MKLNDAFARLVDLGDGVALKFSKAHPWLGILGGNVIGP